MPRPAGKKSSIESSSSMHQPAGFVADRKKAAARVEQALGYRFRDRALLEEALTHSWPPSKDDDGGGGRQTYQRLEFIGDAALGLAFSTLFSRKYRDLGPGVLTVLRSANTSNEKLARAAVRHDLYPLLRRHNCDALDHHVVHFTESMSGNSGEVKAPKVLADIVEAIAGAIYVDSEYDLGKLQEVVELLCYPIINEETLYKDHVSMLNEYCQKHRKDLYKVLLSKGARKVAKVTVDAKEVGTGYGKQKNVAERNAAREALANLMVGEEELVATTDLSNEPEEEVGKNRVKRWLLWGVALWLFFKLFWN